MVFDIVIWILSGKLKKQTCNLKFKIEDSRFKIQKHSCYPQSAKTISRLIILLTLNFALQFFTLHF